ncbi:hypothetical protein MMC34_007161 [Xylographa carneopallida]|nr:hypothetical protein [Xylographa carneopallida]
MPDLRLPEPQVQLGEIEWQESYDTNTSQDWFGSLTYDNALLPLPQMANEPLESYTMTAYDENGSILDNSPPYTTNPMISNVSATSRPKVSMEGASSVPESSSASRSRIEKRTANTLAARRYRQNRLNMISELELLLKATQQERDALKIQLARLQGENQVLKDLVDRRS